MVEYYLSGAALLQSPELAWLAGKALALRMKQDGYFLSSGLLFSPLDLPAARPPDIGSCLIFGNSGLPTTKGTLAPDKVILRDGWADDSTYALLNLRFSGWHRYKATNTLTLLYQDGPLVTEKWTAGTFWWLPKGRGAFRDKRVPRENLNGLLLPKSGLSRVLWVLSGLGSGWMQNPPAYAEVEEFFTSDTLDGAKVTISDWNGWRHERTVYLIHDGLVLVVDEAVTNDATGPASLVWHLNGNGRPEKDGLRLDNDQRPARLVWSENAAEAVRVKSEPFSHVFLRNPDWELLYTSPDPKRLNLATGFLMGERVAGEMRLSFIDDFQGLSAVWHREQEQILLLHNSSGQYLDHAGLGTDGAAVVFLEGASSEDNHLCYVGGHTLKVALSRLPRQILHETGAPLSTDITWQIEGDRLVISFAKEAESGCFILH